MNFAKKNIIKSITSFLVVMLLFSCENKIDEINSLTNKTPHSDAKNITIIKTDSAKIVGIIFAKELIQIEDEENPYTEFPQGLEVKTYKNYPKLESSIYCNYAKHFEKDKIWLAQNDVIVVNSDGVTLNTEELYWDLNTQKIHTDKDVKITTDDELILGKGMVADQDFQNYELTDTKGIFSIEE